MKITDLQKQEIIDRMEEIKKLYELSEAEARLLEPLLASLSLFGLSRKLMLKELKALTAIMEMFIEVAEKK